MPIEMRASEMVGLHDVSNSPPAVQKLKRSADDFEAMVIDQLIQPMFATLGQEQGMFDGGAAEQTLRPLLLTEFSKMMEARGGLGLEKAIMADLARGQGARR